MRRLGVLTSGGDAQGMNAAVRAVVRMALDQNIETYAIYEGYQGMVDGGNQIRPIGWNDVGGILQQGGTVIGSARCAEFHAGEVPRAIRGCLPQRQRAIGGGGVRPIFVSGIPPKAPTIACIATDRQTIIRTISGIGMNLLNVAFGLLRVWLRQYM